MGVVFKQSFSNLIITYIGFAIGAVNTLFLYARFLTDTYYGLVGVILATSAILMPLLALGVPNTLIKFYSAYTDERSKDGFLFLMLLLPLAFIVPLGLFSYLANEAIGSFIGQKNAIVEDYVWHIFLIAMAMAYFEIFYSWSRIHMRSVFGNFMKEIFGRLVIFLLLFAVHFNYISVITFMHALVGVYLLRTLIMKFYAFSLRMPKPSLLFPSNFSSILTYSLLIILGGSTAVVLLEVDKFMINQFIEIEKVAYYTVAVFIATVIAVPSRAMHQITYPMTASLLNNKDHAGLAVLYRKSSLTLFIVSGLIFILVLLNLGDLYLLLPENYRGGFYIVLLIGLARVFDALLGNNNAILYNSDHYRAILWLGVLLAVLTIILNWVLIPITGITGAALATFLAVFLYNLLKLLYVRSRLGLQPFSRETFKVFFLLAGVVLLFLYVQFPFHPVINIALKSLLITLVYVGVLYRFRISEDVYALLSRYFKRIG
ncbi:Membrane protein involved in the export of O-antigen and teichoic acid [Muriicola jejuensis]|uniref:Oligosaccharide flippase family protein n=1 Tax=Muriicola jejuensis TaxID=504488 RepID=A0A6P0ULQ1_9FLAO|nr:polysaccharide biosynthesis C-terminal domain-containing protein [Muriicola jejuensis]NER11166.1 oligosaccharide flippase family protein [Muriicola jejuensis]SMP24125.1 Membrane protein involved in the export of O-antigen and teichoic acid [Muriicola jejuensis]